MVNSKYKWFVFCSGQLLIEKNSDQTWAVPTGDNPPVNIPVGSTIHDLGDNAKTYIIFNPVSGDKNS